MRGLGALRVTPAGTGVSSARTTGGWGPGGQHGPIAPLPPRPPACRHSPDPKEGRQVRALVSRRQAQHPPLAHRRPGWGTPLGEGPARPRKGGHSVGETMLQIPVGVEPARWPAGAGVRATERQEELPWMSHAGGVETGAPALVKSSKPAGTRWRPRGRLPGGQRGGRTPSDHGHRPPRAPGGARLPSGTGRKPCTITRRRASGPQGPRSPQTLKGPQKPHGNKLCPEAFPRLRRGHARPRPPR